MGSFQTVQSAVRLDDFKGTLLEIVPTPCPDPSMDLPDARNGKNGTSVGGMTLDRCIARLVEIRAEIERHEAALWRLRHEADQLQFQVRALNAKQLEAA